MTIRSLGPPSTVALSLPGSGYLKEDDDGRFQEPLNGARRLAKPPAADPRQQVV